MSSHDEKPNLRFYLGERLSVPDGRPTTSLHLFKVMYIWIDISAFLLPDMYIHDFHNEWYQNYNALESVHTYIQW